MRNPEKGDATPTTYTTGYGDTTVSGSSPLVPATAALISLAWFSRDQLFPSGFTVEHY